MSDIDGRGGFQHLPSPYSSWTLVRPRRTATVRTLINVPFQNGRFVQSIVFARVGCNVRPCCVYVELLCYLNVQLVVDTEVYSFSWPKSATRRTVVPSVSLPLRLSGSDPASGRSSDASLTRGRSAHEWDGGRGFDSTCRFRFESPLLIKSPFPSPVRLQIRTGVNRCTPEQGQGTYSSSAIPTRLAMMKLVMGRRKR